MGDGRAVNEVIGDDQVRGGVNIPGGHPLVQQIGAGDDVEQRRVGVYNRIGLVPPPAGQEVVAE
jgi:hypothetical protein